MKSAKITFRGTSPALLDETVAGIKQMGLEIGAKIRGPVSMRTKRLIIPTRKSPDGEGTETWDHWKISLSKRVLYSNLNEKFLKKLLQIKVPESLKMSIVFED